MFDWVLYAALVCRGTNSEEEKGEVPFPFKERKKKCYGFGKKCFKKESGMRLYSCVIYLAYSLHKK